MWSKVTLYLVVLLSLTLRARATYDIDCYHCSDAMDCLTPGSTECSYRQGCIKIIARNNTVIRQGCSPVETKKTSHELDLRPYGLPPNLKVYACWTDFCNAMDSSSFLTTSSVSVFLFSIWIGLSL